MLKKNLILVGWYHSHPRIAAQPTLRDCDAQLEYQIKMRGTTDETYTPCIGLICAPYYSENLTLESSITAFWVVPPTENRLMEYGRPMSMHFSVTQDIEMSEHIKTEMILAIDYYRQFDNEMVKFDGKYGEDSTFIEKLKTTLYSKFPREQNDFEFWNWLRQLLRLAPESEFKPPKWSSREEAQEVIEIPDTRNQSKFRTATASARRSEPITINLDPEPKDMKDNDDPDVIEIKRSRDYDEVIELKSQSDLSISSLTSDSNTKEMKDEKLSIRSLQEQLKLPSGLNMTPSPISSIPLLQKPQQSKNASNPVSLISPRDSPITIPSNSASPATKYDLQQPPATPSPAKSDTSMSRHRNSPLPSNLSKYASYHNTPTSSKQGKKHIHLLFETKLTELLSEIKLHFLINQLQVHRMINRWPQLKQWKIFLQQIFQFQVESIHLH